MSFTSPPPGSRLPALGSRGQGWVAGQVVLIAAVLASALLGRGWSGGYAVAGYAAGGGLLAAGVALLVTAGLQLGSALTPFPAPRAGQSLTTTGVFALARHPMYGGGILVALGWTIVFGSIAGLVCTIALAVFLDLKSRREELWLSEQLPGYGAYRERTPRRLLPFLY